MAEYSNETAIFLLDWMNTFLRCKDMESIQASFNELKTVIPFDHYGIASYIAVKGKIHSFETVEWFRNLPGFQDFFLREKMYEQDAITQETLRRAVKEELFADFWPEVYSRSSSSVFMEKASLFDMPETGYTVTYKPNLATCYSFSIAGDRLPRMKQDFIVNTLSQIIRIMPGVMENAKLGKTAEFTDKQFEVFKLLKTSLTYDQIAQLTCTTVNSITQHCQLIKKKLGLTSLSRGELIFGRKE